MYFRTAPSFDTFEVRPGVFRIEDIWPAPPWLVGFRLRVSLDLGAARNSRDRFAGTAGRHLIV